MNRLLIWYCRLTIWFLKKYSDHDMGTFVDALLSDTHINEAYEDTIREQTYVKNLAEREAEKSQMEKDKADMLKFLKDNPALEVKLEEQDWVGFKLGNNGTVPPPVYQRDWPRMTRKKHGST